MKDTDHKHEPLPLPSAPLAYHNEVFLNSPEGRILRLLAEYQEPLARFRKEEIQDTVVFFGSARFDSPSHAADKLDLLRKPGSAELADHAEQIRRAEAAVKMARYYEDARRLAFLLTQWSSHIPSKRHRFVVTTGGGPGIMEAANQGAYEAGGKSIGLNIRLPFEQMPNHFITPALNFEFHYFFMRKFWFAYLAKALVIFPGGFGTFDELFEILTLAQTEKLAKKILVLIYGREYWNKLINFDAMVEAGTISPEDVNLFHIVDTPEEGFEYLRDGLTKFHLDEARRKRERTPEIAKTRP